jgi:hypothetical protein
MTKDNIIILSVFYSILFIIFGGVLIVTASLQYTNLENDYNNLVLRYDDVTSNSNNFNEVKSLIGSIEATECPSCECKAESYCKYPVTEFKTILTNNANMRDYVLDEYDCTEFSEELDRRLDFQGFNSKTKLVHVDCDKWTDDWDLLESEAGFSYDMCKKNNLHQIVELNHLYVEATTGEVIMPEDLGKYGLK